jgi:hypothetical protein
MFLKNHQQILVPVSENILPVPKGIATAPENIVTVPENIFIFSTSVLHQQQIITAWILISFVYLMWIF